MKIGVYGLGRFGSFWAELLSHRFSVTGYNRSANRLLPPAIQAVSEEEVLSSDVLFLCVAISSLEEVLERIRDRINPSALVFDTCSVKVHPVRLMERILPGGTSIIGSHPMFGPDSARNGLSGLPIVLSPVRNTEEQYSEWEAVFSAFGLKVLRLSPEDHDREAAYTQGITHFIGRVLKDLELKESPIATLGYGRLLQVVEQTCNDPWQLFLDLQQYNPYTHEMREELQRSLKRILDKLEASLDRSPAPGYDYEKPNGLS